MLTLVWVLSFSAVYLSVTTEAFNFTAYGLNETLIDDPSLFANAGKPGYESIQAMGRSFSLGYLYDIRSDKIISKSLWDRAELDSNVHEESSLSTRFIVQTSETINDKSSLVDLSASIKASFLGGLISVTGSAKFMDSRMSHSRATSVTLKSEKKSRTRRLSMDHFAKITYPQVLHEEENQYISMFQNNQITPARFLGCNSDVENKYSTSLLK